MYFIAYIILLSSLSFMAFSLYRIGSTRQNSVQRRLQRLQATETTVNTYQTKQQRQQNPWAGFIEKNLKLFETIGIEVTAKEVTLLCIISYLSIFLLIFLLNKNIISGLVVGLPGLYLPTLVISTMVQRRMRAFDKLFGDALYLIANTLKSGFGFRQALQIIATEMPEPINQEFELLNQELNWGLSLNDALVNLGKRVHNEHVDLFITAVVIQNEIGGSLSEIINKIAETIRTKDEIRGELNVLTSQGKVSGFLIGILPFIICGLITIVNPAYMGKLFQTTAGVVMVAAALLLEMIGIFIIRLIVQIE